MTTAKIRKIVTIVEETHNEADQPIRPATRRAAAVAVIENPFAGRYVEDLEALMVIGEELGAQLGAACVAALGIEPAAAQSYGKAALVGENGELEHAAAILHPRLGKPLRAAVEKGAALVPSNKSGDDCAPISLWHYWGQGLKQLHRFIYHRNFYLYCST